MFKVPFIGVYGARRSDERARRSDERARRSDERARRSDERARRSDERARRSDERARRSENPKRKSRFGFLCLFYIDIFNISLTSSSFNFLNRPKGPFLIARSTIISSLAEPMS